jgi:hypothetical protein
LVKHIKLKQTRQRTHLLKAPLTTPQHPVIDNITMAKAHFVLVHGAYHQPQHWDPLVKLLQSSGHATSTARLPSVSSTPPPECLKADAAAVKQAVVDAIAQGATTVVPVLHSYAGIPGFEGLATLTPEEKAKIPRVICISAFVIPKDNSLVSVQEGKERTYVEIDVRSRISHLLSSRKLTSTTRVP